MEKKTRGEQLSRSEKKKMLVWRGIMRDSKKEKRDTGDDNRKDVEEKSKI